MEKNMTNIGLLTVPRLSIFLKADTENCKLNRKLMEMYKIILLSFKVKLT